MEKTIFLEPVGTKYHSFKRNAEVEIKLTEESNRSEYQFTLFSFGSEVLTVSIIVTKGIEIHFRTTQELALGKELSLVSCRHLKCFLNYCDLQSGQPIKRIYEERFKGSSLRRKLNFVPYIAL